MGIITKEVKIKPTGKMIQYYRDNGYNAKYNESLTIRIEDLMKGSHALIDVKCEICNKISTIKYKDYNKIMSNSKYYCCEKCAKIKRAETIQERYGCKNVMQNEEIYLKQSQSLMDNYGVNTPLKSKEIQQRMEETMIRNFGAKCSAFSSEIRERISNSLYINSSQKSSRQQRYICNLYNGILNYPVKYYNCDIYLPEDNLICEYDGGFHAGNVITGRETQAEFDKKEIIRNNVIKREGYKQMRIISSKDLLPSDEILLQLLSHAKQYFSKYPNHSWINFDIDNSRIINVESKDSNGVFFDYGKLRRITDSDPKSLQETA